MKNFKKVLAAALSAAMVLTAAPVAGVNTTITAEAAKTAKITGATSVYKKGTANITVKNVTKKQYVVVSVSGGAKKKVQIKKGSKVVLKYGKTKTSKINGTGKNLTFKVTNKAAAGKSYKVTVKVYNKSKKKLVKTLNKTVKVYAKTTGVTLTPAEAEVEEGKTVSLTATTTPAKNVKTPTWSSSDTSVATVNKGVVTGIAPGEATITVDADGKKATAKVTVTAATASKDVKISGAKVTAADTIEVTFADKMDAEKLIIGLALGTVDIAKTVSWDETGKIATLKTTANLAKGTYTITASYAEYETSDTAKVEVEAEKATEIKILNTTALTAKATLGIAAPFGKPNITNTGSDVDGALAYAYYDVLDQYGNSMRSSVSIDWSASTEKQVDKSTGKITLWKGDGKAFTYGEKVYVTGVDTKTGLVVNQELSIGQAQALDSIKMVGFIKKGTTAILQTVPKNFKKGEYQLVFSILDQNGNEMDASDIASLKDEVTFTTDDVLVVSKVEVSNNAADTHVTLDGVVYGIASLEPGINVGKGGAVKITAIANKTGKQTPLEVNVELEALLANFTIGSPMGIITDGDDVELSFEATDVDGKPITSFKTIAQNKTFNTLSFSVSGNGTLTLSEKADGTAKLEYSDAPIAWTDSTTTDGIDRTISLTSIVVGGNTSSEILQVQDKAYPASVLATTELKDIYVEGSPVTMDISTGGTEKTIDRTFEFVDQYGRSMKETTNGDNGFFSVQLGRGMSGTEFSGYNFGLRATYLGNGGFTTALGAPLASKTAYVIHDTADGGSVWNPVNVLTTTKIDGGAMTSEDWKFEIVKSKGLGTPSWQTVSKAYNLSTTIVDIANVSDFTVGDGDGNALNKFYIGATNATNTDEYMKTTGGVTIDSPLVSSGAFYNGASNHGVYVFGKYNGKSVKIPATYLQLTAKKLTTDNTTGANGDFAENALLDGYGIKFQNLLAANVKVNDLYDKGKTNYPAKDCSDTITVNISPAFANAEFCDGTGSVARGTKAITGCAEIGDAIGAADQALASTRLTSVSQKYTFSDQPVKATSFKGIADDFVVEPTMTNVATNDMVDPISDDDGWSILDQYGEKMYEMKNGVVTIGAGVVNVSYKVSSVKEAAGYVDNNFKTESNDSTSANIKGAELGDTYKLTIDVDNGDLIKDFNVKVGADTLACIDNFGNWYLNTLVGTGAAVLPNGSLEYQRQQIMK